MSNQPKPLTPEGRLPHRVVVGRNGAYWRDYGDHYSMCPVSEDNDPVEPVAVFTLDAEWAKTLDVERLAQHRPSVDWIEETIVCACGWRSSFADPAEAWWAHLLAHQYVYVGLVEAKQEQLEDLRAEFVQSAPPGLVSRIAVWRLLRGTDAGFERLFGASEQGEGS